MTIVEFTFTAWEEEDTAEDFVHLTGKPSFFSLDFSKLQLPKRRSAGANYHIEVSFTSDKQGISSDVGPNTAVHECSAELHSEGGFLRLTGQDGVVGAFSLEPFGHDPAGVFQTGVDWKPKDSYSKLQIRYDSGDAIELSDDLQAYYQGRISGTAVEQRFPHSIHNCIMYNQTALVVLDTDEAGVDDPTCECENGRNLFAIGPSGEVAWCGRAVTEKNTQFVHRIHWLVDDHLFSKMSPADGGRSIIVELDPETGEVISTGI
ncbi:MULTISPECIES: hypothetical protein [unclassified Haloarcula]|uniref:hypothetical protein n=1 Tax=unclassified Haloarcula TaxID=2624677 RepID=UPI0012445342|nr:MULTISPECIES: hypothetical protein [unclassified Haloarcula]